MKKFIIASVSLLVTSSVFGLSCMQPDPLPPLNTNLAGYETIGLLEVLSFGEEGLMEVPEEKAGELPTGMNLTAEGNARKYTTHTVKWTSLKKGIENSDEFMLRINATSWMGTPTMFEPGTVLPITTGVIVENNMMVLDQDFGCGRSDWARYSIAEVSELAEVIPATKVEKVENKEESQEKNVMSLWESFKKWFTSLFG